VKVIFSANLWSLDTLGKLSTHKVKRLYITEKAAMASSLAEALAIAFGLKVINTFRQDGYYRLNNGDGIVPLRGHVLDMEFLSEEHRRAPLGTYFDFLPIVVTNPSYKPRLDFDRKSKSKASAGSGASPMKEYLVACDLLRSCDEIVHVGDTDREGQLIIDELIEHVGIDPAGMNGGNVNSRKKRQVWRLPLITNIPKEIAKKLVQLQNNGDPMWQRRGSEARVRQILDAALGLNGSMAMQEVTGIKNISVGRVQTPLLELVRVRDDEIASWRPSSYYVPKIHLRDGTVMRWHRRPGAAGLEGFDSEGRIIDASLAKAIEMAITAGMKGKVSDIRDVKKSIPPPLVFSAASLISTASKRLGVPLADAERAAQRLWDKHKAVTYIGTDCQYLPESLRGESRSTIGALARLMPGAAGRAELHRKSPAWNDSKVVDHHGIIPTGELPRGADALEGEIYSLVARRYIAQFCKDFEVTKHTMTCNFGPDEFVAQNISVGSQGWMAVDSDEILEQDLNSIDDSDQETLELLNAVSQNNHSRRAER
jgi:DNA topoisomerase-3